MSSEIGVTFVWNEARPDNREFRQNSCVLVPLTEGGNALKIWVGIPFDSKHIHNYEEIVQGQLNPNQTSPEPILTAEGMRAALDGLGKPFPSEMVTPDDFKQENPDVEDWSDTSTEPTSVAGVDAEIDWSDGFEPKTVTEIENGWSDDADWDKADNEVNKIWNEDEEDWTK